VNADTTTCITCGTPITAEVLGGKCPTCLKKVALAELTLHDDTALMPHRAATPPVTAWEPPSVEEMTALLPAGAYTVESMIGRGGMGAVYRGVQLSLKRAVAIKLMRQDQGEAFRERFLREAHTLARLSHPGIVNVIDCGEAGSDLLYIIMEFVDGADLLDVIRSGGLTQERALQILPQICEALQFAHDHGIVHRDIKPSNILLTRDGRVKVADFGLAKALDPDSSLQTQSGAGLGTPDYAAPEQFTPGAEVDHRADIYALGVMIYQMITGKLPRGAWKPPSQSGIAHPQWDVIVRHAMQPRPEDRYTSVSEMRGEVEKIKSLAGTGDRAAGREGRGKVRFLLGAAAALALAAGGYLGWEKFAATPADNSGAKAAPLVSGEWVDATPELRRMMLNEGAGKLEGDWLLTTKRAGYTLTGGKMFRDVAMRVTLRGSVILSLRRAPGVGESAEFVKNYAGELSPTGQASLYLWDAKRLQKSGFTELVRAPDAQFDPHAERELMMIAQGDQISLWQDGRLLLSQKDSSLKEGNIALNWFNSNPASLLATRIKKVEYADLTSQSAPPIPSGTSPPPPLSVTIGSEWTDLVPHIQPKHDAIRGNWSVERKGLSVQRMPWAACRLPVQEPAGDYDLRYRVTRGEGSHMGIFFAFRKRGAGGTAVLDFINPALPEFADGLRRAQLEQIVNPDSRDASASQAKRKEWLPEGREATVLLQVRETEVIVSVDDAEAFRWTADWSRLRQRAGTDGAMFSAANENPVFGVGVFDCDAVFRSIEMRQAPVSDIAVPATPVGEPGSIPHLLTSPDYEWTAPVNLGPLVNSPALEVGVAVSPDGLRMMFGSKREGDGELFESRRASVDAPWGKPALMFRSAQPGMEEHPWISQDGLRLYYHSTAGPGQIVTPVPTGDIYFRERAAPDQPWSAPVNLGTNVNQVGWDSTPRLSKDELTLIFTTIRPGGQGIWDIWRCRRATRHEPFGPAENVEPGINSPSSDIHAMIASDNQTILFLRTSSDLSTARLFMATPDAKGLRQTTALDFPVTGKLQNPWLSEDGQTLWFAWNGPGTLGDMDLWESRRVPMARKTSAPPAEASTTPGGTSRRKDQSAP